MQLANFDYCNSGTFLFQKTRTKVRSTWWPSFFQEDTYSKIISAQATFFLQIVNEYCHSIFISVNLAIFLKRIIFSESVEEIAGGNNSCKMISKNTKLNSAAGNSFNLRIVIVSVNNDFFLAFFMIFSISVGTHFPVHFHYEGLCLPPGYAPETQGLWVYR